MEKDVFLDFIGGLDKHVNPTKHSTSALKVVAGGVSITSDPGPIRYKLKVKVKRWVAIPFKNRSKSWQKRHTY